MSGRYGNEEARRLRVPNAAGAVETVSDTRTSRAEGALDARIAEEVGQGGHVPLAGLVGRLERLEDCVNGGEKQRANLNVHAEETLALVGDQGLGLGPVDRRLRREGQGMDLMCALNAKRTWKEKGLR